MSISLRRSSITLLAATFISALSVRLAAQDVAPSPSNVVAQGTVILIELSDRLDTRTAKSGDHFEARLAEPLTAANGVTLPVGKKIKGHVSAVEPGMQRKLLLSFDRIETGHGWSPLIATVTGVPGEHGLKEIGEEGEIGRKGMTREQIAEAAVVGAGEGAADGARNGGGKRGAAEGAGSGAVDGAVSAFESGHDLILEKGTALEIRLDRNLVIPER